MAESPNGEATVPDALKAVGFLGPGLPSRAVLHGAGGTVVLLTTLDSEGRVIPRGLWVAKDGIHRLGPRPPASLLTESLRLTGATAELVNLLQAGARSDLERLEGLGERVDGIEEEWETVALGELGKLNRLHRNIRKSIGRFSVAVQELDGPFGGRFPGLEQALPRVQAEFTHLEEYSAGVGQSLRDLLALRTAAEANRLSEATNRLGQVSNQIAAYANTSNIRMLGIAYVALVLALVSAVVLIPNTAATILGMPSASWVPGLWVDVILTVLAILPIVVVFSRPWVKGVLGGLGSIEARTREGLRDLPEISPAQVDSPAVERELASAPPRSPP
ncbi:MAG: hypothetical protein L3K02_03165 [Thermoplasmata archaeon]|nr:hypothetical protein [Thermoplasmata archaeon]